MSAAARRLLYWSGPMLACLWVYWPGLLAWFQQDDFAWLGLGLSIYDAKSFLRALFAPMAQGTIRPWSERVFFLVFRALFDMDALPFRIWAFLTQFAALALLAKVTARLSGSRQAGFWAALIWGTNSALAISMSWTSAYNQSLCAVFLLLSLFWLIKYTETGLGRYNLLQWVTFLLGFGALELNVVYPALAATYAWLCARRHFVRVLPMFVPSFVYTLVHNYAAPKAAGGVYALYFDGALPETLATYLGWTMGSVRPLYQQSMLMWAASVSILIAAALCVVVAVEWRAGRWAVLFPLGWYLITLAPYLPLKYHRADYYLAVPTAGFAMLAGWAFARAWRAGWFWRPVAVLLLGLYVAGSVPVARTTASYYHRRSLPVRQLFFGIERARQLHPDKVILLTGASSDLFWAGIYDNPFRLHQIRDVYLAPGSERTITPHPELGDVSACVFPPIATARALEQNRAVVYAVGGEKPVNVTTIYRSMAARDLSRELARRVDAGQPLLADQLGPTWYPIEHGYRWMPKRATVRLGGTRSPTEQLYLEGFCPEGAAGATMIVKLNGIAAGEGKIDRPGGFELRFQIPASLVGVAILEVELELSRTVSLPEDGRELGAAFGVISIR